MVDRKALPEGGGVEDEPTVSFDLIGATGAGAEALILDVGGGASVLVERLCAAGYRRVAVLDVSPPALALARQRLGAAAVEWHVADITTFSAPHPFDVWHDRAVFRFLSDPADRRSYVETLRRTVPAGGHVIVAAFAIGGPTRRGGREVAQYDSRRLCQELGEEFLLVEEADEGHRAPDGRPQKIAYFRFIRTD